MVWPLSFTAVTTPVGYRFVVQAIGCLPGNESEKKTRHRRHTNPGQKKESPREGGATKGIPLSRHGEAARPILPQAPMGLGANTGVNGLRISSNTHLTDGGKTDLGMPL